MKNEKKINSFSYSKNMANFEVFLWSFFQAQTLKLRGVILKNSFMINGFIFCIRIHEKTFSLQFIWINQFYWFLGLFWFETYLAWAGTIPHMVKSICQNQSNTTFSSSIFCQTSKDFVLKVWIR